MNIADQVQRFKLLAAVAMLVLAAFGTLIGALHFGALVASIAFASITVGALIGAALTRWTDE